MSLVVSRPHINCAFLHLSFTGHQDIVPLRQLGVSHFLVDLAGCVVHCNVVTLEVEVFVN